MKTRKNSFSMIEMLVVITIIGVMSSMIIGSFDKARDMAGRVTCLNNIKNIGVMTELYRKNNKVMPYTATWLTDFSFAAPYNSNTYSVFNCNGDKDGVDTKNAADLKGKTSYYFIPARATMLKNWQDAIDNGMSDSSQIQSTMTTAAIYDKSPSHHKGYVNIVYLMSEESDKAGVGTTIGNRDSLYVLDVNDRLNLPVATVTPPTTTTTPPTTTTTPPPTTTPPTTTTVVDVVTISIDGEAGVNPNNSDRNHEFTYVLPSAAANEQGGTTIVMATLSPVSSNATKVIFRSKNGDTITINGVATAMNNKLFTITTTSGHFHFDLFAGNAGQGQYRITFDPETARGLTVTSN